MRVPALLLRPLAAVLAVSTLGCYSYVPLEDGAPEAGQEVRIEVAEAMGEPARTYSGRILRIEGETVVLSQNIARSAAERGTVTSDQVVRVRRSRIRSVERQEISFWKSAALIGGGGVAATIGLAALAGEFSSDVDTGGGDDTDSGEASISIPFSLPIP
ncbi:MAG: hypothetical protein Q8W44_04700 [Candidatus Palauibacterales bacterium]|nr:hypothetical protein [Candidatus Palauibacterales bacterium]